MIAVRVVTALLLGALVLGVMLWLETLWFALLTGAFVLLGAWEWSRLAGMEGSAVRAGYVLAAALLGILLLAAGPAAAGWVSVLAALCWLAVPAWLARYSRDGAAGTKPLRMAAGLVVLLPAWAALVALHGRGDPGIERLLFLLVLVWGADTAAFFAGRRFGRVPLAPAISPGKTREGVAGAAVFGAAAALAWGQFHGMQGGEMLIFVSLSLATVLISVVGDLFESMMKRAAGVKDSGTLLPGHGGVLDRVDSLTAAAPLYLAGLLLAGWSA